ncbi:hypothetical protein [Rhodococcus ruber]|uniref:hypothetical protein n=1 Tax=Rhodococcus ruber TaxID=1830 RepID=UPI00034606B5|nr:hypothetical protein [Rhodococcus ruber]
MATSPGGPVFAPLRRWVLYSRTNLALAALAIIVALFLIGQVVGEPPPGSQPDSHDSAASVTAATDAMPVSYELVEVSESTVAGQTAQWTTSNAPATAMAYLHTFLDPSPSDADWINRLARYTADRPGGSFAAARPRVPVAITGFTRSELVTGESGQRLVLITIPTQTGPVRITAKVLDTRSGQKWAVDTPLPTVDLSTGAALDTSAVAAPATTSLAPTTTSVSSSTSAASPSPSILPIATSAPSSTSQEERTERVPDPVPVSGPLPIPELDTPIPGAL